MRLKPLNPAGKLVQGINRNPEEHFKPLIRKVVEQLKVLRERSNGKLLGLATCSGKQFIESCESHLNEVAAQKLSVFALLGLTCFVGKHLLSSLLLL